MKYVFLLLILAPIVSAGFILNTTADWDAGIKSNSSGNYEIETYTDNLRISNNTFALGNKYSDRFTFPDSDATNWKWNWDDFSIEATPAAVIVSGVLNKTIDASGGDSNGYVYGGTYNENVDVDGDLDIQVDIAAIGSSPSGQYPHDTYSSMCLVNNYDDIYAGGHPDSYIVCVGLTIEDTNDDNIMEHNYIAYDYSTVWTEEATSDTSGKVRITREDIGGGDYTLTWYHWNGAWDVIDTITYNVLDNEMIDDSYMVVLTHDNWVTHNGWTWITYDNFNVVTGTMEGTPYRTSGNWTSASQTMSGSYLSNTTINHSGASANNYIDKIEWLVGGDVKATYDTDITSGTSTTISSPTSGSFEDVDSDFQIKVYLVGDGTGSPAVRSIEGEYYTETEEPVKPELPQQVATSGSTSWILYAELISFLMLSIIFWKVRPAPRR